MCFTNKKTKLDNLREGENPITVWKVASYDEKTGAAYTSQDTKRTYTEWKKGTVVKPHIIRNLLRNGQQAGSGLYFYTNRRDARTGYSTSRLIITATVKPKDIIAANYDGSIICVIAATVIDAPTVTPTQAKIKWLNNKITAARTHMNMQKEQIKIWNEAKEDQTECLQQMIDEIKELKKKVTK